jgi:putative hydrolase of the HAD superfamily
LAILWHLEKKTIMPQNTFDVLLFDFGGVLIRNSGVATMMKWTDGKWTLNDLWQRWLSSESVRSFETGRFTPAEFSEAIVHEFNLPVHSETFLNEFVKWSTELFPGTIPLLKQLSETFQLASLSNTNPLHWEIARTEMKLTDLFDYNFPSHETGFIKPDRQSFENVAHIVSSPPERILFFDDIRFNVESARQTGMSSFQVCGVDDVIRRLKDLGIL